MLSSMSSNAILAKARAMYGKRLTESDFRQLMECRTVPEIAVYLKTRTSYKNALTELNDNEIHRGQLEPMLRQNIYSDIKALSRYAEDKSRVFTDFIISEMEIEQIIRCLMLVNIGKADEYVYSMPLSLDDYARISLRDLASVRVYDDLVETLSGSKYAAVLRRNRPEEGARADIALIEAQLYNENYARVMDAMIHAKKARDRDELKDIFSAMLDFRNVSRIVRLKRFYRLDADRIRPLLIPYGRLSQRVVEEICAAPTVQDSLELINGTYLGRIMSRLDNDDRDQMANTMINIYCRHHLRLSPNPTIVMISYVYLKDIELRNIINIIEATRYGWSAEEKAKLLIE